MENMEHTQDALERLYLTIGLGSPRRISSVVENEEVWTDLLSLVPPQCPPGKPEAENQWRNKYKLIIRIWQVENCLQYCLWPLWIFSHGIWFGQCPHSLPSIPELHSKGYVGNINNILVYSCSLEEYIKHVWCVLQSFLENLQFVKPEKCKIHIYRKTFLDKEGIIMVESKVTEFAMVYHHNHEIFAQVLQFHQFL